MSQDDPASRSHVTAMFGVACIFLGCLAVRFSEAFGQTGSKIAFLAGGLIGAIGAFLILRSNHVMREMELRKVSGLCPNCGYDLRASKDRCPECGLAIVPQKREEP